MEAQIENINIVIPVIEKKRRGRPIKIKVPVVDALPVVKKPKGRPPTAVFLNKN